MEITDNWAAFGSEYLKAIDVLNNTDEYVIVDVSSKEETRNGKKEDILNLTVERNESQKLFGCNKTNGYAVQNACPNSPKDSIGKIVTFNKVDVQKPGSEPPEIVKGLRIVFKGNTEEPSQVDTENAGLDSEGQM